VASSSSVPVPPDDDPALSHFVRYLRAERNASEHTVANYAMDIRQFITLQWGGETSPPFRWKEADKFSARRFLVTFQKAGSQATTTRRKMSSLRSFFRFMMREEYVATNPFVGLVMPKRPRNLPRILSVAEVGRLLEAPLADAGRQRRRCRRRGRAGRRTDSGRARWRDAAMLEVLYSGGLRVAELTGLGDAQIDFLSGLARVRGKGKKERLCPLGGPACRALQKSLELRDLLWAGLGQGAGVRPRYSSTNLADRLTPRSVERHMKRYLALAAGFNHESVARTRCGTVSPPICWMRAPTCAACRNCWAMRQSFDYADLHPRFDRAAQGSV
jgi:integrase/recombinase XerC